jgi:alkylation response protein AidB-like acyl-CoA dehydrogenase
MTDPTYQRETEEQEAQMLAAIDKWLERDVRPHATALELADEYPTQMVEQMKALGLFGATIGEDYGGLGLSAATYARIVSRISEVWMSLTGVFNTHLIMARAIERFGTLDQKNHFLPRFATGELRGALGLTEPDAGTDLQGIKTRAEDQGDGTYKISGTKMWITNGIHCDAVALLVKTDSGASPPHKGMSMFIAEKGDGFVAMRKLKKLGYRGVDTAELVFDKYIVSKDRLIGGEEGLGFKHAMSGLELGRINVAARGVGVAKAALDEAVKYSQVRKTMGKPICEHQAIQLMLAEMACRYESGRALTTNAAKAFDRGDRVDMEAGMAKYVATEAALNNAMDAMRVHGGYGYSPEYPVERLYRDAPLLCIGEGTNEIQRVIIARQLVARNPA